MRIYTNPMEMLKEVERDMWEMGIRVQSDTVQDKVITQNTIELYNYVYSLTSYPESELSKMIEYFNGNHKWAAKELEERLTPIYINPGLAWHQWSGLWEQYLHFGKFQYTYNQRIRTQLELVIRELRKNPYTRQAVLTVYDQHQDIESFGGKARVPCSMHYQFLYRQNRLNMLYVMRSCDFLKHFVHDVYLATGILEYVAGVLALAPGHFTHCIGSLHAFEKDMKNRGIF